MSKLIIGSALLSNANVANYHSTRFGGQQGITVALGERDGKVVAFWGGKDGSQVVKAYGNAKELESLPKDFKASTGLEISEKSLQKLANPHMAFLVAQQGGKSSK